MPKIAKNIVAMIIEAFLLFFTLLFNLFLNSFYAARAYIKFLSTRIWSQSYLICRVL